MPAAFSNVGILMITAEKPQNVPPRKMGSLPTTPRPPCRSSRRARQNTVPFSRWPLYASARVGSSIYYNRSPVRCLSPGRCTGSHPGTSCAASTSFPDDMICAATESKLFTLPSLSTKKEKQFGSGKDCRPGTVTVFCCVVPHHTLPSFVLPLI